jgi:hypothetical protein
MLPPPLLLPPLLLLLLLQAPGTSHQRCSDPWTSPNR